MLIFGLQPQGLLFKQAWFGGLPFLLLALLAVFAGALVTPVLLPFVPFRSFALKGWIVGVLSVFLALHLFGTVGTQDPILLKRCLSPVSRTELLHRAPVHGLDDLYGHVGR